MLKITSSLNIAISYLVVLALSSSRLIQFKGLFDQPSLPLPLSLRVVRGVRGAVALISTEGKKEKHCASYNVTVNHVDSELGNVVHIIKQ